MANYQIKGEFPLAAGPCPFRGTLLCLRFRYRSLHLPSCLCSTHHAPHRCEEREFKRHSPRAPLLQPDLPAWQHLPSQQTSMPCRSRFLFVPGFFVSHPSRHQAIPYIRECFPHSSLPYAFLEGLQLLSAPILITLAEERWLSPLH